MGRRLAPIPLPIRNFPYAAPSNGSVCGPTGRDRMKFINADELYRKFG